MVYKVNKYIIMLLFCLTLIKQTMQFKYIPSLSDAFGCNLFEHFEDNLFIIIVLQIFLF